ncbi:MAG: hypothetical protein J3Q66DRAFT_347206 [Benniella sp.]|nr:MAG: hypothetical protein J3Q66DRAFT_347206 [Benniella sp.]
MPLSSSELPPSNTPVTSERGHSTNKPTTIIATPSKDPVTTASSAPTTTLTIITTTALTLTSSPAPTQASTLSLVITTSSDMDTPTPPYTTMTVNTGNPPLPQTTLDPPTRTVNPPPPPPPPATTADPTITIEPPPPSPPPATTPPATTPPVPPPPPPITISTIINSPITTPPRTNSPAPPPSRATSFTATSTVSLIPPIPSNSRDNDPSKLSPGAIAGIVIAVLVALIAALVGIFMIKKRHRDQGPISTLYTSDTMFDPVRLDMQENRHHLSGGTTYGNGNGNAIGRTSGGLINALSGRDSFEPLNTTTTPTNTLFGASGISGTDAYPYPYPYPYDLESNQYIPTAPGSEEQHVRYIPPIDPGYSHYSGYVQNPHHPEHALAAPVTADQQGGEEALYPYHHQPHYQHEDDLHAPATYNDPGTATVYYHDQGHPEEDEAMQQQYLHALQHNIHATSTATASPVPAFSPQVAPNTTTTGDLTTAARVPSPSATASVPAPGSSRHSIESDAAHHQSISEPWPENRNSTATTDSHSSRRNPQMVNDVIDGVKVPVSDGADAGPS